MRHRVGMSKFLLFALVVLGLCVASLPPLTMAKPPTPTPLPPRPRYESLERAPFLPPSPRQTATPGNVAVAQPVSWSKLVFQFFQSYIDNNWEIYLANGDGSNKTRLTDHIAVDIYPRLNRGCTRIVFASNRTGNYEIFTMNPDGSGLTQLTSNGADDVNPFWSPDGTRIAFQSYRDGQAEIYVMNADGSGQTRLTWDSAYDGMPAWSPDGTKIAFVSRRTGGHGIWVMNADGGGQMQLANQPYSEGPAWSPDGSQIAYDCDGNNDGWQELWLMNADGSNQRQVYDPGEDQTDAWGRSWSPDGRYVAFTRISWIYYQGNWYWTTAYLDAWDSLNPWSTIRLSSQGMDWHPDWQTTDILAPASSVQALPTQSPGPFTVSWSGADPGPAGLKNYDVQVKDGSGGAWADWQMGTTDTSASYPGVGGHTYYFRSRARDNAYNVEPWPLDYDTSTTVESLPPTTAVQPLPAYSHNDLAVSWGGSDSGGSGIQTYDVQIRDTAAGSWTDWQMGTTITSTSFSGIPGHTYYFRSRARDNAQNVESWPPEDGDTSTTIYTWAVTGTVRDNRDTVVVGTVVTTTPSAFYSAPSDANGAYTAYVADASATYTTTWAKPGYGALPPTSFPAAEDAHADAVLPPADNLVRNWGFESGSLGPEWFVSGVFTPGVTSIGRHSGSYAALLGRSQAAFPSPENASNTPGQSQYPQLAVDRSGTAHVVWQDHNSDKSDIYYARRSSDGTWSSPQNISNPVSRPSYPQLAIDGGGTVHVVWANGSAIYYARQGSDGIWSSPQSISNTPDWAYGPQLAVEGNGVVHVVWFERPYLYYADVYYARRGTDGIWSNPQNISNTPNESAMVRLVVEESGTVHVVWVDYPVSGEIGIYYTQRGSDGTWSSPQNLSIHAGWPNYPQLAVDGSGVVRVVWIEYIPENTPVCYFLYSQRRNDGVWSTPHIIFQNSLCPDQSQLAIEGMGAVHVAWRNYTPSGTEIYHAWRGNGGFWSAPQNISNSPGQSAFPQMAVDEGGIVHLIWVNNASGNNDIYYTRRGNNSTWSSPQNISQDSGDSAFPQLAVERSRVVHVVWQDDAMEAHDIYYVRAASTEQTGDSSIAQPLIVSTSMPSPTISFLYQFDGASPTSGSWFNVQVDNGITSTTFFSTTTNTDAWTHCWFDLTPWAGQAITLTFTVHQTAGRPYAWAYLDEVTLGSAYPDLWVSKSGEMAALPGEQVVYTIAYGNRGGAAASGVRITDTLPASLSFVEANPPPVTTLPLVWEVGELPAKSGPFTIVITATVAPAVMLGSTLTNTVTIGAISPEIETANNTTQAATFIGYRIYLPISLKTYLQW